MLTPLGWRSAYCFTAVDVLLDFAPITNGPRAQIFFGWHVFVDYVIALIYGP